MTRKRVTLHPLREDGTIDLDIGLYPKTFVDGIIDRKGQQVDVATKEDVRNIDSAIEEINNALREKVDKIIGKGLSTNDFTNTYKEQLDELTTALNSKVDKVAGKGLSTNDFNDSYKQDLEEDTDKLYNVRFTPVDNFYNIQGSMNIWDNPNSSITIDGDGDGPGGDNALIIQRDRFIGSCDAVKSTFLLPLSDDENKTETIATQEWINDNIKQAVSLTYAELVGLKNSGELVPGTRYRITDYTCSTAQSGTSAANNPFDIVVTALTQNSLSENVQCCMSERDSSLKSITASGNTFVFNNEASGVFNDEFYYAYSCKPASRTMYIYTKSLSTIPTNLNVYIFIANDGLEYVNVSDAKYVETIEDFGDIVEGYDGLYFAASNVNAWKVKYCLDNDTNRFAWADAVNGKGVIYYMRDEFGNEASYDFKNMLFARYKVTACANCPNLVGRYVGVVDFAGNPTLTDYMTIDTTDSKYFYTFDCYQTDYSLNKVGSVIFRNDGSGDSFELTQIQCKNCTIPFDEHDSSKIYLNNFVLLLEDSRDCMFRISGWCENSTFLGGASQFSVTDVVNSLVGTIGQTYIDGYTGYNSTIDGISNSMLVRAGDTGYAFYNANINLIYYSCLIAESYLFHVATIGTIVHSTIIAGDYGCFVYCNIHYIAYSELRAKKGIFGQSDIIAIVRCTISSNEFVGRLNNIGIMQGCEGVAPDGLESFVTNVVACQLYNVIMEDTSITGKFICNSTIAFCGSLTATKIMECNINFLNNCTFKTLNGCSFKDNKGITCAQDLEACNFEGGVNYITISSTTTAQTISHTNFFDVSGEENNVKTVALQEDYSTIHTVNVYSTQPTTVIVA